MNANLMQHWTSLAMLRLVSQLLRPGRWPRPGPVDSGLRAEPHDRLWDPAEQAPSPLTDPRRISYSQVMPLPQEWNRINRDAGILPVSPAAVSAAFRRFCEGKMPPRRAGETPASLMH